MTTIVDSCQLRGEIKQVIQFMVGEGYYSSDNELLIDIALTFSYPVNLTY